MYKLLNLFALFALLFCLSATVVSPVKAQTKIQKVDGVQKEKRSIYKVQVGAYKVITKGKFDNLNDVGPVYLEDTPNGMKRIIVGDFSERGKAEETLAAIKKLGYTQAYIVTQSIEVAAPAPAPLAPKAKTETVEKMEFHNAVTETAPEPFYVIQLGAYKSINLKTFGNVVDLGDLVLENENGVTKVTISRFVGRASAEKALAVVKQRGYGNAFLREDK